jgi:hypothetical protein
MSNDSSVRINLLEIIGSVERAGKCHHDLENEGLIK